MPPLSKYAEEEGDAWELEQDLELPNGGLVVPPSPTFSDSHDLDIHGVGGFGEGIRDSFAADTARLDEEWTTGPDAPGREDGKTSSLDSTRTDSTTGTLKGLMDSLSLGGNDDLTAVLRESVSSAASTETATSTSPVVPADPEMPRGATKTTTLRASSTLSQLLASASRSPSGRGKVHHLGSTPHGMAKPVDVGDWDQDLEGLDSLQLGGQAGSGTASGLRVVGKKGSFASHISLDDDDGDDFDTGSGAPGAPAASGEASTNVPGSGPRAGRRVSIAEFSDADEDLARLEEDFDLPSSAAPLSLAPRLSLNSRASVTSLSSDISTSTSFTNALGDDPVETERRGEAAPAGSPSVAASPLPTIMSASESETPPRSAPAASRKLADADDGPASSATEEDDADFFEHLVLPSYFLGDASLDETAAGPSTPPTSEGESEFDHPRSASKPLRPGKVDLQSILREKLEQRGGRGLLFGSASGSSGAAVPNTPEERERLERHREKPEEVEAAQLALELSRHKSVLASPGYATEDDAAAEWTARAMRDRMRTISGARAREAQLAREARASQRAASANFLSPHLRRAASEGKVPAALTSRIRSPTGPLRADTMPVSSFPAGHPASSAMSSMAPRTSRPSGAAGQAQHERPPSAASSRSTESGSSKRRPPQAPSASSRGHHRTRPATSGTPSFASLTSQTTSTSAAEYGRSGGGGGGSHLRPRRSQQQLTITPTSGSAPDSTPALNRRRSLQSMSSLTSPTPGSNFPPPSGLSSRPTSRQQSLRSPSPGRAHLPSYAAPTAASASRVRERVQSLPSSAPPPSPIPTVTLSGFVRHTPASARGGISSRHLQVVSGRPGERAASPTKPSLGTAPRLPSSLTTNTARSRAVPTHYTIPRPFPAPVRSGHNYGDGTELDAFDDLPVSKEREKERVVAPVSRKSSSASSGTSKNGSWSRKEGTKVASALRKSSGPVKAEVAPAKTVEKPRLPEPERKKTKRRREPHLIRHLGGSSMVKSEWAESLSSGWQLIPRLPMIAQGEMTYNPTLHRWEGNEGVLREFDKVLATSTRPALISPLSSTLLSPGRSIFAAGGGAASGPTVAGKLPPGASPNASRATAKVVGDMVFDPATCTWHSLAGPDAEDELELDTGGGTSGGENADDEAHGAGTSELDGWELGERERMLQTRASFVLEEGSEGDDEDGSGDRTAADPERRKKSTKRQIWRESKAAQERCRVEMRSWISSDRDEGEGSSRRWLWDLRHVRTSSLFSLIC